MQTTLTTKTCQTTDATPKGSYLLDKVCLVVDFEGICLAMDLSEKVAVSSSLVNLVGAIGLDVIRDRFITDHPSLFLISPRKTIIPSITAQHMSIATRTIVTPTHRLTGPRTFGTTF